MINNGKIKLHRRIRPSSDRKVTDTAEERRRMLSTDYDGRDYPLLEKAYRLWQNLAGFRAQAARALTYIYGDQWAEEITVNGETMSQRTYLVRTGNIALQSNQLKKKLNTTVGAILREEYEPSIIARDQNEQQYAEVMHEALLANCNKDAFSAVLLQMIKDAAATGMGIGRESYESLDGLEDTRTQYVENAYFFCDSGMTDPRFRDLSMIGQFMDVSWPDVVARFGHCDSDVQILRELYPEAADPFNLIYAQNPEDKHNPVQVDFFRTYDKSRCRVYEIWTKECRKMHHLYDYNTGEDYYIPDSDKEALAAVMAENKIRKETAPPEWGDDIPLIEDDTYFETFWYGRFLAPDGTILWEGESEAGDKSHPFVILVPSSEGGIIQSYLSDGIDHQILINRAIVLDDWLTRTQAKGVTFMPRSLVKGHEKEIEGSWAAMADLIYINDPEPGSDTKPFTVNGNTTHYDAASLISMYKSLLEDSVTAGGAISGDTPTSGTSAALYAQQTNNSATPMLEFIKNTRYFVVALMKKKLKNIITFYSIQRLQSIAGNADSLFGNQNINLNQIADIEYDLDVRESTSSPAYKLIKQQRFDQLLQMGAISSDEYFKYSGVEEGNEIMQDRQARQTEMQAAGIQPQPQ